MGSPDARHRRGSDGQAQFGRPPRGQPLRKSMQPVQPHPEDGGVIDDGSKDLEKHDGHLADRYVITRTEKERALLFLSSEDRS